jgi:UDPglucose 6-dehydrogenase
MTAPNIGWVGLGKLGSVCAAVLARAGFPVKGFDPFSTSPDLPSYELGKEGPRAAALCPVQQVDSLAELVEWADVVFVAVQTPHEPGFGGDRSVPFDSGIDFEYAFLLSACRGVAAAALDRGRGRKPLLMTVVSTVLPGTCDRMIRPLLHSGVRMAYNPFFIAMGTTVADFLNPEFVLVGADNPRDAEVLRGIYRVLHDRPVLETSITSAELAKVAYNTFISLKIVFGNTIMEISDKTGADCDQVIDVLSRATDRVISPAYLRGGMGDGGACHPRDNIAMSALAKRLDLSVDLMGYVGRARETQTRWLAKIVRHWATLTGLPVVLLGKTYKPGVPLTDGSPALLLASQLDTLVSEHYDCLLDSTGDQLLAKTSRPAVFVITTAHKEHALLPWPTGSVVIDPHGYIPDQSAVTVVRPGRGSQLHFAGDRP